ncbi:hypothetical protein MKQ70_17150 [Chitinophaga sedimenti]|uniref:hypothetical protein n=1 Tax=Chitinophaga sedimenti TaxID=2033606 RepID=UPI0020042760|nr:hypothetical protein [Chitinophaga sedimenti]MCK7556650.1 hypothetical protein [Chitinophaga sedimenti]
MIWNYARKTTDTIKNVTDFHFAKPGNQLLVATKYDKKDSLATAGVYLWNVATRDKKLINTAGNYKLFMFDDKGEQVAYIGERDSAKAVQKLYSLYYYKPGADSGIIAVNKDSKGVPAKWNVSENGSLSFSKDGKKLFFGTAPIPR